jgi:hypothetical protein
MLNVCLPSTVADFLNDRVIPLFDSHQMLMRLLTTLAGIAATQSGIDTHTKTTSPHANGIGTLPRDRVQ